MPAPLFPWPRCRRALVVAAAALLAACATPPPATEPEALAEFRAANDPFEPFNRSMFAVNEGLDAAVVRPVVLAYRNVVPEPGRTAVRNVLRNIRSPVILLNDILQGNGERAANTFGRFVVNSTLGIGGIFDVAGEHLDMPFHNEDFGQTLAVWGVPPGPYLFLPLLGPTNPRDGAGLGVDVVSQPLTWIGGFGFEVLDYTRFGIGLIDTRENIDESLQQVRRTSLDPYATIRSATRQGRAAAIANRDSPPIPPRP